MPEFFQPHGDIDAHTRRLPHWHQDGVTVVVTWRLADALPAERREQWRAERDVWLRNHPEPWDETTEEAYHVEFSERFDAWLDAGTGSCLLRDPAIRAQLAAVLMKQHGIDYELHTFVIMPNHVHVVFSPQAGKTREKIVGTWKGVSAHRINPLLNRHGQLWQQESWDRLIAVSGTFLRAAGMFVKTRRARNSRRKNSRCSKT